MAESISINLKSVVSQGGGTGASGGSQIEVLKKKLISLQKDLKNAISERSKEGQEKAKLIQLQIQMTQTKIEQLIQQAQQAKEDKMHGELDASSGAKINRVKKENHPLLGNHIDAFV